MDEPELLNKLKEAYASNTFDDAIKSIEWEKVYGVDGRQYYCKGGFILIVDEKERFKPSAFLMDSSYIGF